ncbi:MAG: bifunctional adenosylcobinamide kinase/adenosylcobinamide-phosphate guanylyltransferase [Deltaproteobacteria bacterium]|nr:bifunctional adenosylcobinamide kinase/adenosylcobinamide-phosphate guanylyltransferase [Deltaproteobacteria bacterium]
MKNQITFVVGGCRSGKSSFALDQANMTARENKYFIATSVPTDSEMEKRVEKHQQERGENWHTIEEPVRIHEKINQCSQKAGVILVDCLTLWVSNLLFHSNDQAQFDKAVKDLEISLNKCECPVFLVSNEVGTGIVPENKLARQFRDLAGFVNQRVAKIADRVIMTVAGIDIQIKPGP